MKMTRAHIIIHGFALLHALVCIACALMGIPDTLILTLATMAMTVIMCLEESLSIEFTAITIVLVNIFGFILGNLGAQLLGLFMEEGMAAHALATFLTTEIIGWSLVLLVHVLKPARVEKETFLKENVGWLVAAVVIVFALRVAIDIIFVYNDNSGGMRLAAEVAAFCLFFLMYFILHLRNQAELEREKSRGLEKILQTYRADTSSYKEKFVVHLNNRIVPVHVSDIAYFYAETKTSFIVTRSGACHPLDESLDTLEKELDPKRFFRISRGCIMASTSIDSVSKLPGGRLDISLSPGLQALTDLTVSRARVQGFLDWFEL